MNAAYEEERLLVDRYLRGDRGAAEEIIRRCEPAIAAVVRPKSKSWGFSHETEEDVLQSAKAALFESLKSFGSQSGLTTYAATIAYRCCVQVVRRERAEKAAPASEAVTAAPKKPNPGPSDPSQQPDHSDNPEEIIGRLQEWSRVRQLLERLEAGCRELIRLRFFDELPFAEIAERINAQRNTVIVRLGRCLDRLRGMVLEEV